MSSGEIYEGCMRHMWPDGIGYCPMCADEHETPKPEAPTPWHPPSRQPDDLDDMPLPARDAGARAPNMRLWHGDIEFIEYAAYEKLERELAEAKSRANDLEVRFEQELFQATEQERTKHEVTERRRALAASNELELREKSAALVEALEAIDGIRVKHVPVDIINTADKMRFVAREALAKWSKE